MFETTIKILEEQIKTNLHRYTLVSTWIEKDKIDRLIHKIEDDLDRLNEMKLLIRGIVETEDSWSYINDVNLDCLIGDEYDGKEVEIYVREVK